MSAEAAGKILEMLRAKEMHLSGGTMSKTLGMSRSAIWKHIKSLRREGYQIEAKPARGYRLVAVPQHLTHWEIQKGLGTEQFGKSLYVFPQVDSTNVVAFRLALNGAQEGAVVVAESQTKGKGRLGRRWESPVGTNIYLSIILRPQIPPNKAPLITLMVAVACVHAIEEVAGLVPAIKWPNDLLLGERKLGGILTEADMEMDRINHVVVGIGINCNMTHTSFPLSIRDTATSLQEVLGREVSRITLIQAILRHLEQWYKKLLQGRIDEIKRRWGELSLIRGKKVTIAFMGTMVKGTALDIDDDGALLLQEGEGTVKRIVAGDVHVKGVITDVIRH
ncbi:MAG: biotin--[acetyl-CoA-carboxylase] ligase [Deltaproteobacteria bacterium]|nr:biotin--[acetyl-CoA-carboxylase] ligase [Deltaproteobacteria bacterium]